MIPNSRETVAPAPSFSAPCLTFDTGMRLRAFDHHVAFIANTDRLKVSDELDPVEQQLRTVTAELARLRDARPNVVLQLVLVCASLYVPAPIPDETLEEVVAQYTAPEPATFPASYTMLGYARERPDYVSLLENYRKKLRTYLRAEIDRAFIQPILLTAENKGLLAAQQVQIVVRAPSTFTWLNDIPEPATRPERPPRFETILPQLFLPPNVSPPYATANLFKRAMPIEHSPIAQSVHGREFRARRDTFPQGSRWPLDSVYLKLPSQPPAAFELEYEIRIVGNGVDVQRGKMLRML